MQVSLKVDVASLQGAEKGVPALLELLSSYNLKASFFFNTLADVDGGWLQRTLGVFSGAQKSVGQQKLACAMLSVHEAGHEIGIRAHDGRAWEAYAANADQNWTRQQLALACDRFEDILGFPPQIASAAGGQVNTQWFRWQERQGIRFASDTRGKYPFYPSYQDVRPSCPQIPVTLPTISELLQRPEVIESNVHEFMYAESLSPALFGHVFIARAEQEGRDYLEIMEKLLVMWKSQEGSVRPLGELYRELELEQLPVHQVGWGKVPGSEMHVAMQSVKETVAAS